MIARAHEWRFCYATVNDWKIKHLKIVVYLTMNIGTDKNCKSIWPWNAHLEIGKVKKKIKISQLESQLLLNKHSQNGC